MSFSPPGPTVLPPSSKPPAALSAFLRGVERRGAVLAELQAGDAAAGDAALADAMRDFRAHAAKEAMSEWPVRFWGLLLKQPRLRHRTPVALTLDATDTLAELGSGPRGALLLRLAAGLSETDAAGVLGVAVPTYRLALQRALPRHADGRADPQAWQRLREQVHRRIKTLPPERLARLTHAREAVLADTGTPEPSAATAVAPHWPRWVLPLLWSLLGLCVMAMVATFVWPWGGAGDLLGDGDRRVIVQPLPDASAPSKRYRHEAGLIGHRDFALIADPDGEAAARDIDFHSWLAARDSGAIPATAPPLETEPPPPDAAHPPGSETAPETTAETADAPL